MKRRQFIKLSSAGLAGAATGNLMPASERFSDNHKTGPTPLKLKKGFMLGTFPEKEKYSLIQQFRMIRDAGFDGVEPGSGLNRTEVLRARDAADLEIPSVVVSTHWSNPLSSPDPSVRQKW